MGHVTAAAPGACRETPNAHRTWTGARYYRALRKSYEDSRNEPGSADFYYGEMEMRRADPGSPRAERGLLTAYWALSGYGLRCPRPDLRVVVNSVIFRSSGQDRTTAGTYTEMASRLAEPVLLGLAVLAVRGRIKRCVSARAARALFRVRAARP